MQKNKSLLENAKKKYDENNQIMTTLNHTIKEAEKSGIPIENIEGIDEILNDLRIRQNDVNKDIKLLEKYGKEISHMKQGSIAMMEQITTVSKMRIYVPKKSTDILYGISFSAESMEKLTKQLINLYIKNK